MFLRKFTGLKKYRAHQAALFILFFLTHCGSSGDFPAQARPAKPIPIEAQSLELKGRFGGRLLYPLAGEPETFNFLGAQDARSKLLTTLTTATLLEFDPISQEVKGGLAKSFSLSPDGKRVTIEFRKGIYFSDGHPFEMEDILFTFDMIYEEGSNNLLKDSLLIDGVELQVRPVSEFAIEIEFPEAYGAALYLLTTVPVLPAHLFSNFSGLVEEAWTLDTSPSEMAGLGPFRIKEHQSGISTLLEYNPHFWKLDSEGRRLPYLDEIQILYVEDRNAQVLRLQTAELDLIDQLLRPDDVSILEEDPEIRVKDAGPSSNLTFFWFNLGSQVEPPKGSWFQNRTFREAISCAVSREAIVNNVFSGYASSAGSLVSQANEVWSSRDVGNETHDPERARALLRSEGFGWRNAGARTILVDPRGNTVGFELLTRTDEILGRTGAVLQQDLAQIGIELSIVQNEFREVISRIMRSGNYDSALMNVDFPIDPSDMLNVFSSGGSMHMWNPGQAVPATEWEARIDSLMLEQVRTSDLPQRKRTFREVQEMMAYQLPIIPLINRNVLVAWRNRVQNLKIANVFPYGLSHPWGIYLAE